MKTQHGTIAKQINQIEELTSTYQANSTLDHHSAESEHIGEFSGREAISCSKLYVGDPDEITRAKQYTLPAAAPMVAKYFLNASQGCAQFRHERGYIMQSVSAEEEKFPLAFSVLLFRDAAMAERLLRAIYRPWNHYCVHVDRKATEETFAVMKTIAMCLPGVFLATKRISVRRETISVVTPELQCMKQLWKQTDWRYFINLTGMEFPIRTNWELVQILKSYNGANDILGGIRW